MESEEYLQAVEHYNRRLQHVARAIAQLTAEWDFLIEEKDKLIPPII